MARVPPSTHKNRKKIKLGKINRWVNLSHSRFWGSLIFVHFPQFCPLVCTICQWFPVWFPGGGEDPVEKVVKIQWDCIPCIFLSLFLFPTSWLSNSDLLSLHYSLPCLLVTPRKGACELLWIIHNIFWWIIIGGHLKLHKTIKLCLIFLYIFPELGIAATNIWETVLVINLSFLPLPLNSWKQSP